MITYRKAEQKDKENFNGLEREFYKAYEDSGTERHLKPIVSDAISTELLVGNSFEEHLNGDSFFHVAEDEGKVVGYVFAEIKRLERPELYAVKETGFVDSLIVSEQFRGKGIGTELLQKTLEWFKSRGVMVCTIGVMKENVGAVSLYEKLGFQTWHMKMWKEL
jgi:ribosomal protein S18 acetylase RimI-like enzyme